MEAERKELMEQIRELKKQSTQPQPTLTKPNESNGKAPTATPELITISPTPFPRPVHNYPPVGIDHEPYLRPWEATELIPKFNGYNIPLHQFINSCEDVAQSLTAYPAPDVLKKIKRRLIGDAERLTYGMEFLTIDSFTQTIKTIFFSQQKTFDEYRAELINLKQRPHENVTQYAARTLELRDSLLNSLRDQKPPRLDYSVAQEEASILEKFVKGLLQQIRIELRQAGYQTIAEAIGKAKTLEKELDITYHLKYPTDDRRQIVRNEIRTYQKYIRSNNDYDQIQNRRYDYGQPRLEHRYPDQPPRYTDRNNDNYNQHRSIMYNDQKYPNANNRNLNRDYNRDIRHFNCYQNLQPRFFPEERRNYRQHNYRNQRSENYENNKTYNTYENSKLKNVGNAFSPLAYYETDRFDTRTDTHSTGSRTAQITRPEAGTELTYAIQQETLLCNLSNTTNSKVFSYNVLPFEPVKFVSGGFLTDPKPGITGCVRVLNPEIPKILLKKQELTPKAYPNDAKNAVTMTPSAFSIQQVIIVEEVINVEDIINVENIEEVKNVEDIVSVVEVKNVEDIIDVEEINDRRININKEVNIEEIDSREINKSVKLRKEKLNGKEINQNNFERKVGELGDGQATSDVDSHTRRPALEGKILEIIKCKEFMAAKPNEATSDVDKSEKIGEKSFNEERNETNQVLKNACETVEETEVEVGEIDDETTYSDFYKLLLEIKIDKEFDIQH
ncbi:hypothetical protein M0802_016756 [Mischocyttarus mexicanus]|nr:hypothetical protein M0802_016756 [Mischocyttarus mexicanus]